MRYVVSALLILLAAGVARADADAFVYVQAKIDGDSSETRQASNWAPPRPTGFESIDVVSGAASTVGDVEQLYAGPFTSCGLPCELQPVALKHSYARAEANGDAGSLRARSDVGGVVGPFETPEWEFRATAKAALLDTLYYGSLNDVGLIRGRLDVNGLQGMNGTGYVHFAIGLGIMSPGGDVPAGPFVGGGSQFDASSTGPQTTYKVQNGGQTEEGSSLPGVIELVFDPTPYLMYDSASGLYALPLGALLRTDAECFTDALEPECSADAIADSTAYITVGGTYTSANNYLYPGPQSNGPGPSPVPEPSTLVLLGAGMLAGAWRSRRVCRSV